MLMRAYHISICCVTVFLHVNFLRVIRPTQIHQIVAKYMFSLKKLPQINLWGLLIEDIEL